ncbi:hypothetical protein BTE77_34490 [Ensifer adhaerens]|nr:hypothetical protein BTE77_34490 [Ensifer adhaerens]
MDEFDFELSALHLDRMRDAAIDRARDELKQLGLNLCEDCREPIGSARRRAIPSAIRCLACQQQRERRLAVG